MILQCRVQVGHFSPDGPSVDIIVDGEPAFENLGFRDISDLVELEQGEHHIEVRPSGEDSAVFEQDLDLEDGMHYTVVASGLLADEDLDLNVIAHEE